MIPKMHFLRAIITRKIFFVRAELHVVMSANYFNLMTVIYNGRKDVYW